MAAQESWLGIRDVDAIFEGPKESSLWLEHRAEWGPVREKSGARLRKASNVRISNLAFIYYTIIYF